MTMKRSWRIIAPIVVYMIPIVVYCYNVTWIARHYSPLDTRLAPAIDGQLGPDAGDTKNDDG